MTKILFIMFQGAGTNLYSWNEYTKSKFLNRLQTIGDVYTYQDKTNNIWYYDNTDPEHADFDDDLNFDLSYVKVKSHIKMVHKDIQHKYKNLKEYLFIPIGWSAGCLFALYFAQKYPKHCIHCILLDPAVWTPKNMKLRLKEIDQSHINNQPINNKEFKKMLIHWKKNHTDKNLMYQINDINHHERSNFFSKHLNLKLAVDTTAFVNINKPEKKNVWSKSFNNTTRLEDIKILKKYNPKKYKAFIFVNKTHYIFDQIKPAKQIIKYIKQIVQKSLG